MNLLITISTCLIILSCESSITNYNTDNDNTGFSISENSFNFGFTPQYSTISHRFWIYPPGEDSLVIYKITPSCGCIKYILEKDIIQAGDSTLLEIIFETKTYRGNISKWVKVFYDPYSSIRIDVQSYVYRPLDTTLALSIIPYKLDFSQFRQNIVDRNRLLILNNSDKNQYMSIIDYPTEIEYPDISERIKPNDSIYYEIILNDIGIGGEFEKSMTIQLFSLENIRFTIPIKRTIRIP
ncbi:MAG: DUF1573 domain-containing protein [bacterium]